MSGEQSSILSLNVLGARDDEASIEELHQQFLYFLSLFKISEGIEVLASSSWKLIAALLLVGLWALFGLTLVTSVLEETASSSSFTPKVLCAPSINTTTSSRKKRRKEQQQQRKGANAILVVDPYSSGGVLARMIHDRGYKVVRVLSQSSQLMVDQSLPIAAQGLQFAATIQDEGDVDATVQKILNLNITFAGFLCGAEPGVELFDAITNRWHEPHILSNGEALSHARRDKYLMGERVREYGVRAVTQVKAASWRDVEAFVRDLYPRGGPMKIVLKPARSSSSEDVYLVESMKEVKEAFLTIHGKINQYGEINDTVLVQEYLSGTEYVVNCVSYNGEHKVVSIWRYDKRAVNGSKFVYFGVHLFESADGVIEERLSRYIYSVLDALDVKHGPSHAEVMWLDNENAPCLVEIGTRPHGGDGVNTELAKRCIGYSQLDAMIDLVEDPENFKALSPIQPRLLAHSCVIMMVSYQSGILRSYPGMEKVKTLSSFQGMELKIKPGQRIRKTVDYLTNPGWIKLVHQDPEVVKADAELIHRLEEELVMYEVDPLPASP